MNTTPSANRIHIIVLGACNSGKSSVINMLAAQNVSLVSDHAGTTTDPVRKAMEIPGIGPVVFIDTAGFDDNSPLGEERVRLTEKTLDDADIALLLTGENSDYEADWLERLKSRNIPVVKAVNKIDTDRRVPDGHIGVSAIDSISTLSPAFRLPIVAALSIK